MTDDEKRESLRKLFDGLFTKEELSHPAIKRQYNAAIKAIKNSDPNTQTFENLMGTAQTMKTMEADIGNIKKAKKKEEFLKVLEYVKGDTEWDF